MKITTFRTWKIVNAENETREDYFLPAGTYEVEEIKCPLGYNCNWYVLKDTLIGASVASFTQWKDCPEGDVFRIVFSDN